jgi:hypothetical protein
MPEPPGAATPRSPAQPPRPIYCGAPVVVVVVVVVVIVVVVAISVNAGWAVMFFVWLVCDMFWHRHP